MIEGEPAPDQFPRERRHRLAVGQFHDSLDASSQHGSGVAEVPRVSQP
jgi:hypothetical protein